MNIYEGLKQRRSYYQLNKELPVSTDEIHDKIQKGYESYKEGRTQSAAKAFDKFRESHN